MANPKKFITIKGKKYRAHLFTYSKVDANDIAKGLKVLGFQTSVRKVIWPGEKGLTSDMAMYGVYKHPAK